MQRWKENQNTAESEKISSSSLLYQSCSFKEITIKPKLKKSTQDDRPLKHRNCNRVWLTWQRLKNILFKFTFHCNNVVKFTTLNTEPTKLLLSHGNIIHSASSEQSMNLVLIWRKWNSLREKVLRISWNNTKFVGWTEFITIWYGK